MRILATALLLALCTTAIHAEEFAFKDGDRVVLLGSTLIEREQRYGYWESALTSAFPKKQLTIRNLGWSGDTVFGIARAGFGSQADGFKHLKEHVEAIKPNVIVVAFGTNESFEGEAGLPQFQKGLDVLLDTLAKTEARILLMSPPPMEKHGKILPDPTEQNRNLGLYRVALKDTAKKRGLQFVDLFGAIEQMQGHGEPVILTDNGLHYGAYGYWRSASPFLQELGVPSPAWRVEVDASKGVVKATGTTSQGSGASLKLLDDVLPLATPTSATSADRLLIVRNLKPGKHTLQIDDKAIITATDTEWAKGVAVSSGPEFDQAEKVRAKITAKNQEYFHRWRPDNETYLFGFRKHEQGQNAVEIPKFDPIVADLEEEIAKLRVPVEHRYEIVPAK